MKKKIKDLKRGEIRDICKKHHGKCAKCPLDIKYHEDLTELELWIFCPFILIENEEFINNDRLKEIIGEIEVEIE